MLCVRPVVECVKANIPNTVYRSTFFDCISRRTNNKQSGRRRRLRGANSKRQTSIREEPRNSFVQLGHKAIDQTNGTSFTSTGTVTQISMPAQGLAYNQRVADRLKLARIDFNFNLYGNTGNSVDVVRCIVLQEVGQSTGAPTPAQILQTVVSQAPLLYNVEKLYHILHDHSYPISNAGDSLARAIRLQIKPRIKDIQFVTGTTTPYSGQIYVLWLSSTTNNVVANTYWRQWYVDSD